MLNMDSKMMPKADQTLKSFLSSQDGVSIHTHLYRLFKLTLSFDKALTAWLLSNQKQTLCNCASYKYINVFCLIKQILLFMAS